MNVAIVGSRSLEGRRSDVRDAIFRSPWLAEGEPSGVDTIISGGADGVDTYAEQVADELALDTRIIEPDWESYGPAAGPKRNTKIIEEADAVIVIWDGASNGTADSLRKAIDMGKTIYAEQL